MGSDLYISIDRQYPNGHWGAVFDGPSTDVARGIVVDAFGGFDEPQTEANSYLPHDKRDLPRDHGEWPWRNDEPYWIRKLDGAEFCAIIREKRWQKLQGGDFADLECSPELRAFAALVQSLLDEGHAVRVWCWHSQ